MPEVGNKLAGHAPASMYQFGSIYSLHSSGMITYHILNLLSAIVGGKRVPGPRTRTESTGSNHNGSRKDSSIDSTGSEEKM